MTVSNQTFTFSSSSAHTMTFTINRLSDAKRYSKHIKKIHRHPSLDNIEEFKRLNVINIGLTFTGSHYIISSLDFKDGTSWEKGKVFE